MDQQPEQPEKNPLLGPRRPGEVLEDIPLDEIFADPDFNCRGGPIIMDDKTIKLAGEILQSGLMHPIIIQPWVGSKRPKCKWRIVVGHRRHRAHELLDSDPANKGRFHTIQCRVVNKLSEIDALVLNVKENYSREDINILAEAKTFARFVRHGWTVPRIAQMMGVYHKYIQVRLNLLDLDPEIQQRAADGWLSAHQIQEIWEQPSLEQQFEMTKHCVTHKLQRDKGKIRVSKKRTSLHEVLKGSETRGKHEINLLRELIQESTYDPAHPAALALCWAGGWITTEEFYDHCQKWADEIGGTFVRPESEVKSLSDEVLTEGKPLSKPSDEAA